MTAGRDADFTAFVESSAPKLRRLAYLLCHDWHSADDLVQATVTRLFVRWATATSAANLEAYVRTMLFREFVHERRTSWARRVDLTDEPHGTASTPDQDAAIDLETAIRGLPRGQRAVLVLRFHCDLSVEQVAEMLGCSQGNVKSQTARALAALRRSLEPGPAEPGPFPLARARAEVTDHA
jgi:RNA polymerase sigma-70 factor (sigma-E family)